MTSTSQERTTKNIKIIGIGNTLFTDEGVGVHLLEYIREALPKADNIEIIEGATDGIRLLGSVEDADYLIFLDAINSGKEPGTIINLKDKDIPSCFSQKMSVHQMGIQDLIYASTVRDTLPEEMYLFGVQPESLEIGFELTECISNRIPELVELVVNQVETWMKKN